MSQRQEMLGAVMYCPQSIPTLFKHHNKDILHKQLMSLLNRRLGVEIECCGNVLLGRNDIISTSQGYNSSKSFKKLKLPFIDISYYQDIKKEDEERIFEHRISFYGYRQLIGVYNFLEEMKKSCKYSESGIHIHVDITELKAMLDDSKNQRLLCYYLNKHIPYLAEVANYTGTMMHSKGAGFDKNFWINISTWRRYTLEFRVFPMTFEYHELIKFCLCATEITNKAVNKFKQSVKHPERIKKIHLKKRSTTQ